MRVSFHIVLLWLLLPFLSAGQISKPGAPPSFTDASLRQDIPVETFYMVHAAALEAEDRATDTIRAIPWRFGENLQVGLHPGNAGLWTDLGPGGRLWQLGIASPGAYSLNLTFSRYLLPPGAELYVYSADRSFVLGAFTQENNQDDMYFATTLVPGDSLVIEYYEPLDVPFSGKLYLETVTHAYRSILDFTKSFRNSGSCHLNVACEEANGWNNEIDAVMLILTGSNSLCTGALINNTNYDGRPFVLTADHCLRNPASLVFWFNWQSETCQTPAVAPTYDAMSGAVTRARLGLSDMWLLELNQYVPLEYNPYFAGWNRAMEDTIGETVVSIHHPRGDIKKFSYALDGAQASAYIGEAGSGTTHWRISWSGGTSTEAGSSGSPLFDASGRIIGQLHGGYARCGNTEPDWYGRFGISWDMGQSPGTRLKEWLDPNGTEVMSINGFRPTEDNVEPPTNLFAEVESADKVQLSWTLNERQQAVLLAYNTEESFGTPRGGFSIGDTLAGGGIIIYMGKDQKAVHNTMLPGETYYYKVWSFSQMLGYSTGIQTSVVSQAFLVSDFPYEESFHDITMPAEWYQDGNQVFAWQTGKGNNEGNPAAPFQGRYNLFFKPSSENETEESPVLASPVFNLSAYEQAALNFHYSSIPYESFQDELWVVYRTDPELPWLTADVISGATEGWMHYERIFPEVSSSFQIGFVARWNGGHGICLDAVRINGLNPELFPAPTGLTATATGTGAITLGWTPPLANKNERLASAYHIFRDGRQIEKIHGYDSNSFIDSGLAVDEYDYFITALYEEPTGESAASNQATAAIQQASASYNLSLEVSGDGHIEPFAASVLKFNEKTPVSLMAMAGAYHSFAGWYENDVLFSSGEVLNLSIDRDYNMQAVFEPEQYELILEANPHGVGQQTGFGMYTFGQMADVSTTVPLGWRFVSWLGNGNVISTRPSFSYRVVDNMDLLAIFDPLYSVSLNTVPPEGGIVKGNGIYAGNSNVKLLATPRTGWRFDHWLENGNIVSTEPEYHFVIQDNRILTAVFSMSVYEITVFVHPEGSGLAEGAGSYHFGDTAIISITPYENWEFIGWKEADAFITQDTSFTFTVESDRTFMAVLEPLFYQLSVSLEGKGTTEPEPGVYVYEKGGMASLLARPDRGWRFRHWLINDQPSISQVLNIEMNQQIDARAVFYFPDVTNSVKPEVLATRIYPNPGDGIFRFETTGLTVPVSLEIYNISGQLLLKQLTSVDAAGGTHAMLDLSGLGSGIYILKASSPEGFFIEKIIMR